METNKCANCLSDALHKHHVVPKVLGGVDLGTNLVWLCEACHGKVHNRSFVDHVKLTREGLQRAKQQGKKLGGLRPGTSQRNEGAKKAAIKNAKNVESFIIPLRESGATLRKIAELLNKENIPSPRSGQWGPSQVKYTLDRLEKEYGNK